MSFRAYLDNIKTKTGRTPKDFHDAARKKGLLGADYKAMNLVDWLGAEYGLGRGHAMAIVQAFKNEGWIKDGKKPAAKTAPAKKKIARPEGQAPRPLPSPGP